MNWLFILSVIVVWAAAIAVIAFSWSRWGKTQRVPDEMTGVHTSDGGRKVCDGHPISMYESDSVRADQDSRLAWYYSLFSSAPKALIFISLGMALIASLAFAGRFFN